MHKGRRFLLLFVVLALFLILDGILIISHISTKVIHFNPIIVDNDSVLPASTNNEEESTSTTKSHNELLFTLVKSSNHSVNDSSAWITQGALVKILLYHLHDEDEWKSEQRIDHNENWEDRFDLLLKTTQKNYKNSLDHVFEDTVKNIGYSSLEIEWVDNMNSGYLYANQFCRNFSSGTYSFYSEGGNDINFKQVAHQFFRWGWHLKYNHSLIPQNQLFHEEEGYMIFQPFLSRHIMHFAESVNHLLNKLHNRSDYPPLSRVYFPLLVEEKEYEWSKTYLSLLLSLFPEGDKPIVLFSQNSSSLHHPALECFKSATLLDRLAYNKDGGIFGGFFPQDLMRGISYRYASIQPKSDNQYIQMLFLERSRGRKWMRKQSYLKLIRQHFPKIQITISDLSHLSYKQQVQLYYSMDLVLGGHGSAMTNVMFMVPHSVLIECNPPFFYEMCFANVAWLSRVHYISVTNYNPQYLPSKRKDGETEYLKGTIFKKRREYAQYNIYPNSLQVVSAVDDAVEYLFRWRSVYQTNKEWSHVFY